MFQGRVAQKWDTHTLAFLPSSNFFESTAERNSPMCLWAFATPLCRNRTQANRLQEELFSSELEWQ